MAYASPVQRPRPGAVTGASYLLYLVALVQLASGALGIVALDGLQEAYVYTAGDESEAGAATVASVVGLVIGVLLAVLFGVLGLLNGKGKRAARVVTWVAGGLSLCCFGVPAAGAPAPTSPRITGSGTGLGVRLEQNINESLPWYNLTVMGLSMVSLGAVIVAVVLLALPAANAYFAKPALQPTWPPGQAPYPGQPPYAGPPPYPGQAPPPGQPPYAGPPPYPGQAPPPGQPPYAGPPPYPGQAPPPGQPPYPGQHPGQTPHPGQPPYPGPPPYPGQ